MQFEGHVPGVLSPDDAELRSFSAGRDTREDQLTEVVTGRGPKSVLDAKRQVFLATDDKGCRELDGWARLDTRSVDLQHPFFLFARFFRGVPFDEHVGFILAGGDRDDRHHDAIDRRADPLSDDTRATGSKADLRYEYQLSRERGMDVSIERCADQAEDFAECRAPTLQQGRDLGAVPITPGLRIEADQAGHLHASRRRAAVPSRAIAPYRVPAPSLRPEKRVMSSAIAYPCLGPSARLMRTRRASSESFMRLTAGDAPEKEAPPRDATAAPPECSADHRNSVRVRRLPRDVDIRVGLPSLDPIADLRVQDDSGAVIDRVALLLAAWRWPRRSRGCFQRHSREAAPCRSART